MEQTTLEILLKLKDEASAAFKSATAGMASSSKSLSSVLKTNVSSFVKWGAAAGVAAGGLAIAFGVSAIKSYGEAQASLARVDATLRTMGDAAYRNRDAILAASEAAVKLGFDDEAASESITRFYQATNDLAEAQKLNNLAMDLARAKNIDLATAAGLVNQVLSGNGRVLKQYQIALDETKTPLEQLGELQVKVAGQAEGFAATFPGQVAIINEAWSNMKDQVGKVLVEALAPLAKQFTEWLLDPKTQENFRIWTENFKSWAEVIIPVVVETFRIWKTVLSEIFDVLVLIGDKILEVINTFKELIALGGRGFSRAMGALSGRAGGGPVNANEPYIVGEQGPELFVPNMSGRIIPNGRSGGVGGGNSGGSGVTVNLSGNFYGIDSDFARAIGDDIAGIINQQLKLRTI